MTGFFAQEDIERVRGANDIVEVIGEYVPLKRAGKNYRALCPFHKEKTPSFNVSPTRQIFKCFGCGKGGNVFAFVMGMERVGFPESIEILARRAGLTLQRQRGSSGGRTEDGKEKVYEVNLWAAKVYHRYLLDEQRGASARAYLERRGFGKAEQEKYRLGYAPDNWEFLTGLAGSKYSPGLLEKSGLVLPRQGGGYYDRLRNRVIFPIFDVQGRVIGFGGRVLGDGEPKYLNSPETSLFDKSRCLYGLNWAKTAISDRGQVMVVEGYTDCLSLMCAGIEWVVATLGTALTEEHVRLLKRYADTAVLVYDGDEAGIRAAERALEVFLAREMEVKVVLIPGGQDPADFVGKEGGEAFLKLVEGAEGVFDLKMKLIAERHDLSTSSGKNAAVEEMLRVVAQAGSGVLQDILLSHNPLLRDLSGQLGIGESALRERLRRLSPRRESPAKVEREPRSSGRVKAEREVLGAVLNRCALWEQVRTCLGTEAFSEEALREIARKVQEVSEEKETFELSDVLDRLHSEELIQLGVDLSEEVGDRDVMQVLGAGLGVIEVDMRRQEGKQILRAMTAARDSGDEAKEVELLKRYQEHKKRG